MKRAKFTLEHLFYPEVSILANPEYDPESSEIATDPTISILLHKTGDRRYQIGMRLRLLGEISADKYTINTFGVGVFTVDDGFDEEGQVRLIAKSGPNIVYGALRDHLATLTGRCPWGELFLQPIIIEPGDFIPDDEDEDPDLE